MEGIKLYSIDFILTVYSLATDKLAVKMYEILDKAL